MLEFSGIHADIIADETGELDVEGARMSGKTWAISEKIRRSCLKHPGIWWLICRYSGTETDDQLRPQFAEVCRRQGTPIEWNSDEAAYSFPEVAGKVSKVFAYGLRTQSKDARYAKIRGSGFAGVWNDQSEELPEDIGTEMRALVRQPDFPQQLIFSPNPPDEEHFLADQFPEYGDEPGRKYYRLSIYDNKHNLSAATIAKMERAYPQTSAKYRSLILGMRGPNITGRAVYEHSFLRSLHVGPVQVDTTTPILEAIHTGQKHPVWLAAQRTYHGGLVILGSIIGKKMFLSDFLPVVQKHRKDWFSHAHGVKTCCDPPPSIGAEELRYSNIATLREFGFHPVWSNNSTNPDVREALIQSIGGMMTRRHGVQQAFQVNADPTRFLMASNVVIKPTRLFIDSLEASYVWDEHLVSVATRKIQHPKADELIEGSMRCLENIVANFCAMHLSDADEEDKKEKQRLANAQLPNQMPTSPHGWLSY